MSYIAQKRLVFGSRSFENVPDLWIESENDRREVNYDSVPNHCYHPF